MLRRLRECAPRAFTLIEMMIVIVVIAILIGVLLPQFRGTQDEAAENRARSEMRTIATAVESYILHNNTTPANLTALTTATPRVISVVPDDPFNVGNDYQYARDTNNIFYVVWSYGNDRAADITGVGTDGNLTGTDDDDLFVTNANAVPPSGGGGGGKVICTELHRQGYIPDAWIAADLAYAKMYVDQDTLAVYDWWAKPLAKAMRRSRIVTAIIRPFGTAWAQHMAYLIGASSEDNRVGRVMNDVGLALHRVVADVAHHGVLRR